MELTATSVVWRAETQDARLRLAFVQFAELCRQHKVRALSWEGFGSSMNKPRKPGADLLDELWLHAACDVECDAWI